MRISDWSSDVCSSDLLRYAEVTPVSLTQPPNVFSTIDAETTVLEGTSGAGASITIRGPGDELFNTTADEEGQWSEEVNLARGRNDFSIGRESGGERGGQDV